MIKGSTIRMRRRILLVAIVTIFVFFAVLIIRLVSLQIISGPELFRMANLQQLLSTKISPKRGAIYDRNMVPIAQSCTVWNVVLEPNYIKNDETRNLICNGLHEILDIPVEKLQEYSKKRSFYKEIKKKVDSETKDRIIEFKKKNGITNGIRLIEDYKRYYPMETLASSVIGFVGSDNQGLAGIESYYDKTLTGEFGKLVCAKNAVGTDMPYDYEHMVSPVNGNNLVLTIDSTIQKIVEENLKKTIAEHDVRNRGAAIAINPQNGEILALAVEKGFDPNHPFELCDEQDIQTLNNASEEERSKVKSELLSKQWRNKAISDNYYPGSVFKMVVAAMGFELGLVDEESQFNCTGSIIVSDKAKPIRCHKRSGHGQMNFVNSFCSSCNPAFISLGLKIGADNFFDFYKSFGFHGKTGIDLPGETSDFFFPESERKKPINLAVASIGQNFGITPMQMVMAACVIANGGRLVTPHVVKEVINDEGQIVKSFSEKKNNSVISEQTSRRVSEMMAKNVLSEGYKNAYVPGLRAACKTGTAEKKGRALVPGEKDYISSCCGFAPAEDPQILVLIYVDTPKGGQYYGGAVAAPMFASIMRETAPYLGIKPIYNEDEMKKYGIDVPDLVGKSIDDAKNEALKLELKPTIIGKGDTIVSQIPAPGSKIAKDESIILYTEERSDNKIKVPKFIGLTKAECVKIAKSSDIVLDMPDVSDDCIVSSQSPQPSEIVDRGSVVKIIFQN